MHTFFRRAALMLAVPALAVGAMAAFGGTSFAGQQGPPPPKPPVVRVTPASPVYNQISCEALNAAQNAEIRTLTADLNAVESQAAHSLGYNHTWFLADAAALQAQIKAIHPVMCKVVGYSCPKGSVLETVIVVTKAGPPSWKVTKTVEHECVFEQVKY